MINSIQLTPAFTGKNRYGVAFQKLDLKRQVQVVLDASGRAHLLTDKTVGGNTKKARAFITYQTFEILRQNNFHLKNVLNFSQRHVHAVVQAWLKEGLASSTLQSRFSVLRWFTAAIGKADMIKDPAEYGVPDERVARTYVAKVDKSWAAQDVSVAGLVQQITEKDGWVGIRLELMDAFGLRIREATLLKPAAADGGSVLRVEEGTKGGRSRMVPIRTDAQRNVLNRAKEVARLTEKLNLIPSGRTLQQALSRTYYICRLFGITKAQLELTPHGLRHSYANDRYEEIAGMPSAVRGSPESYDSEADRIARETVSRELGHSRLAITAAYTGARVIGRPKKTT